MSFELSMMDIASMMGSDTVSFRKEIDRSPALKGTFLLKETYSSQRLRNSGLRGYNYVADLLEGKAVVAETPEILVDKMIKLTWTRKAVREEYINILKELPVYILSGITDTVNKELKGKK
jgi:hypothetical protein